MTDIFLSYAREDRPWASRLAGGLIERGWSLFWDHDIPVGKTFDQVIEHQLDASGCIVVLWSRHSVSSNWVKAEAGEGARRGILHPVLIEDVRLPLEFRRLQTANLVDWQRGVPHGEFDQLVEGIAATLGLSKGLHERLQQARSALGLGDSARCLEILVELADGAEAAGLTDAVAELKRTAEAQQDKAHRDAQRRQRARAEERRVAMDASRSRARAVEAATRASALWVAAEAKLGDVAAAFDDEAYLRSAECGEEAIALYGQAAEAAQEVARREAVERQRNIAEEAHERMARARESAPAVGVPEVVSTVCIDAEAEANHGQGALAGDDFARAGEAFEAAAPAHPQAENAAREHAQRQEAEGRAEAHPASDAARDVLLGDGGRDVPDRDAAREVLDHEGEDARHASMARIPARVVQEAEVMAAADARPGTRASWRRAGYRLAAGVGSIAIVLSTAGMYWYRSAHEETPAIVAKLPHPTPESPALPLGRRAAAEPSPTANAEREIVSPESAPTANRTRETVEGLREKVVAAREQAAKASAETLAGGLFATAAGHQGDGEAAFAGGQIADAEAAYRVALDGFIAAAAEGQKALAAKQVETARLQTQVEEARRGAADAEQARARVAAAKRAAEQVAARFYAYRRFVSAQDKEREGAAALGRAEYKTAIRLLGEAQAAYQAAAQEARLEAETDRQLGPARAGLDQAHTAAAAGRQQALAAEANRLAREVFDQAQARQVEADGLASRQDLAAATRAYQDAAERYGEAILRARAAPAPK